LVVVLIILLFVFIRAEDFKRKHDLQEKLGTSSGNIPVKAIDRVLENLAKFRKLREKEFAKEDRMFKKMTKRV